MDLTADPTIDFFRYASGHWIDTHPIPQDKSSWTGFDELRERNLALLRGLLEDASKGHKGSHRAARQKVGEFYSAAMDLSRRERLGLGPIRTDLNAVEAVSTSQEIPGLLARLHRIGVPGGFDFAVSADRKNSSVYALYLVQGGLSLPDRDYYLLPRFATLRRQYSTHLRRVFLLAGELAARARASARAVLSIETALARASRQRAALRNAEKNYHRFTVDQLARRYPRIRWKEYLTGVGVRKVRFVVVGQPEFFAKLTRLLGSVPVAQWKSYLKWKVLHDGAPHLHSRLDSENFDFFHRRLLGQPRPEPVWKRATRWTDQSLGEALGRFYVERYFPPQVRARMLSLVNDVRNVFRARLAKVPWMTPTTRRRAVTKFDRFTTNIGHPSRYRNYAKVRISAQDHLGNVRRARRFEIDRDVARIGGTVDRSEWHMTPPTVNAYFVPTQNQIFFPAGILQPPFFDPTLDDAVNFGGIAVVIGHEITHGYDDQGRKYDQEGNLRDWWSPADAREYGKRANRIIEQYSGFEPLPGLHLNGELTAGENIADLGGVSLAFEALHRRLASGRTPRATIDGFTPEQRFFLSFGQIWRGSVRDQELKRRVSIDPHSPGRFRINGAVSNLPEFWAAFHIPSGAPMRHDGPAQVVIW
ncbi:MAG: M13 family metallopeptidase [Thermoplasmata archaeon]